LLGPLRSRRRQVGDVDSVGEGQHNAWVRPCSAANLSP